MRTLALLLFAATAQLVQAAASGIAVTPSSTSVEVLQSQVLSARFFVTGGAPSVGEAVVFSNDSCGTFSNGGVQITVVTDGTGLASTPFTAGAEFGRTCIVRASAGATVQFNTVSYRLDQVRLRMDVLAVPNPPLPGRAFTIEALAMIGSIELPNIDFMVRVIPGTRNASISSTGGNTGALSRLQLNVFPEDLVGDFEIEFAFRTVTHRFPVSAGAVAGLYQDMWWAGGAENGWGMSVVQHGDTLFVVLFVYGDDGRPTWYVMSGGAWNAAHTAYTGALYLPRGSPFFAYDASRFDAGAAVGEATLTFNDASNAFLDYRIGTRVGTKAIARQPFGSNFQSTMVNRGDMFWGGPSQNGWGVASLQQYDALFTVWFTYDAAGLPTWFVMPAGSWTSPSTYEGRLYRTTSSDWVGAQYRPASLQVIDVGPYRLRFTDGLASALDYTVEARTGTLSLMRQGF